MENEWQNKWKYRVLVLKGLFVIIKYLINKPEALSYLEEVNAFMQKIDGDIDD